MNQENQFEIRAAEAEQALSKADKEMENSINELPDTIQELTAKINKLTEDKAEEILDALSNSITSWFGLSFDTKFDALHSMLEPLLSGFPPELGGILAKKFFSLDSYKQFRLFNNVTSQQVVSLIFQILGEFYNAREKKTENESSPVEPLSYSFDEEEVKTRIISFGAKLPENTTLTFNGDVGLSAGYMLNGGTLILNGSPNRGVGAKMKSGILDIRGPVHRFPESIFSPENKGTVIWQGVTIWQNGKKTAGFDTMAPRTEEG